MILFSFVVSTRRIVSSGLLALPLSDLSYHHKHITWSRALVYTLHSKPIIMQSNKENEREDGEDGWKEKGNSAADAGVDEVEEGEEEVIIITVPTKTHDGGSRNQAEETRPDVFRLYSDYDTRMLALLGLQPSSNPNEGEQEDWRQLTGFQGIGEARRRRNDEDGTTQRKTRLSYELHSSAFENMWFQRGELSMDMDGGQQDGEREGQDANEDAE
jgi:hypothetical protein